MQKRLCSFFIPFLFTFCSKTVCKPVSVFAVIHLELTLLLVSSNLPRRFLEPMRLYLVLLPVGFAKLLMLPQARCALTTPFHPYLINWRYIFCGTFPRVTSAGYYPALSLLETGLSSHN